MPSYLVTGGAGFIGSNLVHHLLGAPARAERVVVLDALTYAGNPDNLQACRADARFSFVQGDICDRELVKKLLAEHRIDRVLHLAAESHVDRSIDGPGAFVRTNVDGTFHMLEASRAHWSTMDEAGKRSFRFVHVSTDEVFGSLGDTGYFSETTPYAPSSPYSATKAASDHLARAWQHTYGLPVVVTNCSNNYGPYQFPEKLIPLMILNALEGKPLPVYGDGMNVRDWLYVGDHCAALQLAADRGVAGETYCIGGHNERANLRIVEAVCDQLDEAGLLPTGKPRRSLITYVTDRPGHDRRYAIDPTKIGAELGWKPSTTFEVGLRKTVGWYLEHLEWCRRITDKSYARERLGLSKGGAS